VRLLADEHVPPAVVSALRGEGHDVAVVGSDLESGALEADLRDRIFETLSLIEDGFRPEAKEYETPAGPVDIWGYDAEGRPATFELKRRRVGPDAVSQLRRYVETVDADVRGILVAPSVTERAEGLLEEFGL
jgi:hypothetical protein